MRDIESIKKIVKETLSGHFDHIHIFKIEVQEDVDMDEDKLLKINIIFEGSPKDLDAEKLTGTIRLLRHKLNEEIHDETTLPLLSFISKVDYQSRASR